MDVSANGTGPVVVIGLLLAFIAVTFGATFVAVNRSVRERLTVPRLVARAFGTVVLVAVTLSAGWSAGCLFWTAARGDYRPYASLRREERPGCEQMARWERLGGSARQAYIDRCIERAITSYEED